MAHNLLLIVPCGLTVTRREAEPMRDGSIMLKNLLGDQQLLSLADLIQAALMLNYNQRVVG